MDKDLLFINIYFKLIIKKYAIINIRKKNKVGENMNKDDFFDFLVATDTLDDFLGYKDSNKNKIEDNELDDIEYNEEEIDEFDDTEYVNEESDYDIDEIE